jgi:membrane protein implicated in regulation of membrane protease activity
MSASQTSMACLPPWASRGRPEPNYDSIVSAWLIWAIAAVLLSVGEIFTPGMFFLGPVALAAVAAAVVALLGVGVALQLVVFIAGSIATVAFLRPIARRHLHMPAALRTGTAALEGTKAVVLQRVDVNGGRVRIGGEEWSARAYIEDQVFEPGTRVEVVKIEGATALVYE